METIANTPDKYLTETLRNESPLMGSYIIRFSDKFLKIEVEKAQRNATLAISHYGAGKFIKITRDHFKAHADALSTTKEELENKMDLKINMAQKNKGRIFSAVETADLLSKQIGEMQKLYEKHADSVNLIPMTQDVTSYAVSAITEKAKKKAAA